MIQFRRWLESEEHGKTLSLPISSLILTKSEIIAAAENIARGYQAMTTRPIEVVDMGRGKYQVTNGCHRLVALIVVSGDSSVVVRVNSEHGVRPWKLPPRNDRFRYYPDARYGGMEDILEPYLLRRLG
jgi:hypothetical protein